MVDHVPECTVSKNSESSTNGSLGKTNGGDSPDEYKETKNVRVIHGDSKSKAIRRNALDQCKEPKNVSSKPSYVLSWFF